MTDTAHIVLWDSCEASNIRADVCVLWRSYNSDLAINTYSLPELVETNAVILRDRYLNWIKDLGFSEVGECCLLDKLEIRNGFSYWWMTLLVEKSYGKSPGIYDAMRLLALEDLCKELKPTKISLNTSSDALRNIIKNWCSLASVDFVIYPNAKKMPAKACGASRVKVIVEIGKSIARIIKYYAQRSPLKRSPKDNVNATNNITIVDYLMHLTRGSLESGQYQSNYWTSMVDTVREFNLTTNWLHHYVIHTEIASTKKARQVLLKYNKFSEAKEIHTCIDAGLSWKVLFCVIKDYLYLLKCTWILRDIKKNFRLTDSKMDLWPLYKDDWINSMVGSTAVWNCFTLNLFEAFFATLKPQKLGIYLQENQGWEAALIHVWRAYGHGKLVGVPHATVRFWDLRYFHASSLFERVSKNALPRPDLVAINSNVARRAYEEAGYPQAELLDVEALRYLYLLNMKKSKYKSELEDAPEGVRILILGDIDPSVNMRVLNDVSSVWNQLNREVTFYVRAHPACPINLANAHEKQFRVSELSLIESLQTCDAVLTGGSTSAAVDAYCSGIQVIQLLSPEQFNMCPLRGLPGVVYVNSTEILKKTIEELSINFCVEHVEYFILDEQIPRWKALLDF